MTASRKVIASRFAIASSILLLLGGGGCQSSPRPLDAPSFGFGYLSISDPVAPAHSFLRPVVLGGSLDDVRQCTLSIYVDSSEVGESLRVETEPGPGTSRSFSTLEAWADSVDLEGKVLHVLVAKRLLMEDRGDEVREQIVACCREHGARGVVVEEERAFRPQRFHVIRFDVH